MATNDTDKSPAPKSDKPTTAEKRWIWVINNEERHRVIALRGAVGDTSKTLTPGPQFALVPGANVIDAKLWKRWKDENADRTVDGDPSQGAAAQLLKGTIPHDSHKHRRAENAGKPYLVEGPTVASRETPLADLDETKAKEMAREVLDEIWLRRLMQVEKRPAVADVIRSRIDEFVRANAQPAA